MVEIGSLVVTNNFFARLIRKMVMYSLMVKFIFLWKDSLKCGALQLTCFAMAERDKASV